MTDPVWKYRAQAPGGAIAEGVLRAPNRDVALSTLHAQRLAPLSLHLAGAKNSYTSLLRGSNPPPKARLSLKNLAAFCDHFADLIVAGLPVVTAFDLLHRQVENAQLRSFYQFCLQKLRGGSSLTSALRTSHIAVPKLMIALTDVGENLGTLEAQYQRLSEHYNSALRLRKDIVGKLIYPAALGLLVFATLLFLSFFILPQFETIFSNSDAPPPPETQFILTAGAIVRNYAMLFPILMLFFVLVLRVLVKRNAAIIEIILLRFPIIGRFLLMRESGAYCRSLSALLAGGMPLARAMPLARGAVSLSTISDRLEQVEISVNAGAMLADSLQSYNAMDERSQIMIALGEEAGELAVMCNKAANQADQFAAVTLSRFANLLSPLMTLLMGLITAGVIAAVMSGVLSLNEVVY